MAALSKFLPYVLPHVAACPDVLAEQAVRSSAIEFCTATLLIQELSTYSVVAGVQDYEVDAPGSSTLVKILGVLYGDAWIKPNAVEGVRSGLALRGDVDGDTALEGTPFTYFQKTPTAAEISLYPLPSRSIADGLAIRAAFAPSRAASVVADELFESWVEEIAAGAISRLMLTPGQPFSNPALAGAHRAQFDLGTRRASIRARTGLVAASSRVQPARFAA